MTERSTIIGLAIAALIIGGIWWTGAVGSEPGAPQATVACQDKVQDRLKAPGTARFQAAESSGSESAWTIRGTVDAENSFGGEVRNAYQCHVKFVTDEVVRVTVDYVR